MSQAQIGFAGLGAMGFGMATHLLKDLKQPMVGFDLYEPSLEKFRAAGGKTSTSPREAATGSDVFISMVATAQQVHDMLFSEGKGAVEGESLHWSGG